MGVKVVFPGYPSCNEKTQDVAKIPGANKWFDKNENDRFTKLTKPKAESVYKTEHVWEKHFVTTFLGWLTFDPPDPDAPKPLTKKRKPSKGKGKVAKATGTTGAPTDAATFKKVFQTKGTLPAFSQRIPASVIANAVSSSAPKERVEEFMILEDKINTAKTVVFSRLGINADEQMPLDFRNLTDEEDEEEDKLVGRPTTDADWNKIQEAMCKYAAVFAYMKNPLVFESFITVNDRVRDILADVDADPHYAKYKPSFQTVDGEQQRLKNWQAAFDYWMLINLTTAEIKMQRWFKYAEDDFKEKVNEDSELTPTEKTEWIKWIDWHRTNPKGLFTSTPDTIDNKSAIALGAQYDPLKNRSFDSMFEEEGDVDMDDEDDEDDEGGSMDVDADDD